MGAACVCFILMIVSNQIFPLITYMAEHPQFTIDLIGLSLCLGFGQFFIYRMIK